MNKFISLSIKNINDEVLAKSQGDGFCSLVYDAEYNDGDYIYLELSSYEAGTHLFFKPDDTIDSSPIFLKGALKYEIPFNEAMRSRNPKSFAGSLHYISAEIALDNYKNTYRNLSINPADQHDETPCFPHAYANVETRGESVFEARNAIDGIRANLSHGDWPYESWGINQQDDAWIRIDFGRTIKTDMIKLYTRADFPHDNWWEKITVTFSNGRELVFDLTKRTDAHILNFDSIETESVMLSNLIKADDPSPFPALTEIEVYGTDI